MLDWFHIAMRFTNLQQIAKGVNGVMDGEIRCHALDELDRVKWPRRWRPGAEQFGQMIGAKDNDLLHALQLWVAQSSPPNEILGIGWNNATYSKGGHLRRNVCPYPAFPTYISGDPSKASSFKCETHARGEVAVPAARYLH